MFVRVPYRRSAALFLFAAAAVLGACQPTYNDRGDLPSKDRLGEIHPGSTTKEQVVKILGSPSSIGVFDDNAWYYISRKTKQIAFFDPDVLDQQVFVVQFDPKGTVRAVGHKTVADAKDIEPAPGATPAPGRHLTFLEQVIGNVGRFNKSSPTESSSGERSRPNGPAAQGGSGENVPTE
jgi:outer membrane protein assembly factor BamE (lipoprotein component of BamABCDE complex)